VHNHSRSLYVTILSLVTLLCGITNVVGQVVPIAVSPELAHRIEVLLRSKMEFPPVTTLQIGIRSQSEVPGYDSVEVEYRTEEGKTGQIPILVSKDGTKLAQFTGYDISADPKSKYPVGNRPSRGATTGAPVQIVGYDDLECPFCARLHSTIFPALLDRYKNQIQIVYRSFPIEGHPWAMRAAIDTDCLAKESGPAYWASIDVIHAQAGEYGGPKHSLAEAKDEIDAEVKRQGHVFGVGKANLDACIAKQDPTEETASIALGEQLSVRSTPTLFINGLKIEGAAPLEFIFKIVDDCLRAEGATPPPPIVPIQD
jgi:protein-disulfide isomerase